VSFALSLPRAPAAASDARHVIRRRLGELLSEDALDDVLLVVTELIANAVVHGRGDITLEIAFDGPRVTGFVADEGAGFAAPAPRSGDRPGGGYGLELVARCAYRWGLHDGSSRVWFEILAEPVPGRRVPRGERHSSPGESAGGTPVVAVAAPQSTAT